MAEPDDPLPLYVQNQLPQGPFDALLTRIAAPISKTCPDARTILESFVESQKAPAYDLDDHGLTHPSPDPIHHYPLIEKGKTTDALTLVKQRIVTELFNAIRREDTEAIALLIQQNLVTADTTGKSGQTPLLQAISTRNIAIVKMVLNLGADPSKFGVVLPDKTIRTPLMLAASLGSLPIVKLLFNPPHSANDALVAPDGQIALRLAASNDHRPIVDFLPSRRAGGFLRFKTHNAQSIARVKTALVHIVAVVMFFVWYMPKFFVWDVPKYLVFLPLVRGCKWFWTNIKRLGLWGKRQLIEMPRRVGKFGKAVWKRARKAPKVVWTTTRKVPGVIWQAIRDVAKAVWNVAKKAPVVIWKQIRKVVGAVGNAVEKTPGVISKAIKDVYEAVWNATKKAPGVISKAIKGVVEAVWNTTKKVTVAIWQAIKVVTEAIWNAAKRTPGVVWQAIKDVTQAVWSVVKKTPGVIWRAIKDIAQVVGNRGKALWNLLTVRIPTATRIALIWTWEGISSLARAIGDIFLRFLSFLHIIFEAIFTFLRNLTLRDIWHALCDFLRAVFVTVPMTLWVWMSNFGDASYRFMKALLGELGEVLWLICAWVKDVVVYVPERLGIVVLVVGGTFVKAFLEIRVWISPKA